MHTIQLFERLTHRYNDPSLDETRQVAVVRVTPGRVIAQGNDYDEGDTTISHVRAPRGSKNLSQALRDTLNSGGCHHEYDCCGCSSTFATVRKVSARDYVLKVSVRFNY